NVMIKVPGTVEGIPAFRQLISEGININVTLLFGIKTYEAVADAFMSGLEALVARGGDPSGVARLGGVFVRRLDPAVDAQLEEKIGAEPAPAKQAELKKLDGKPAIANAKLAYQLYKSLGAQPRWQALAGRRAQTQRLLWASTSTKNP